MGGAAATLKRRFVSSVPEAGQAAQIAEQQLGNAPGSDPDQHSLAAAAHAAELGCIQKCEESIGRYACRRGRPHFSSRKNGRYLAAKCCRLEPFTADDQLTGAARKAKMRDTAGSEQRLDAVGNSGRAVDNRGSATPRSAPRQRLD
jgi:hypothetical protein